MTAIAVTSDSVLTPKRIDFQEQEWFLLKKLTIHYIILAVIVAIAVFTHFFIPDQLIKDIALSCAIIYFWILVLTLKIIDGRKQTESVEKSTEVYTGYAVVLGFNFFIQIFSDDKTMKNTSLAFAFVYFTIFAIIYLVKRK
ncbi:hypothetical protein [Paenibacillus sp. OSY-SE]|uniref:hypothetical protein n=1 Tax=Paenibacillus sp. OSY-SE TaxID=1196323 RepID=UPI00031126BB|nr:hypothetical protein [Paenibacillus sp. OSY-SE]